MIFAEMTNPQNILTSNSSPAMTAALFTAARNQPVAPPGTFKGPVPIRGSRNLKFLTSTAIMIKADECHLQTSNVSFLVKITQAQNDHLNVLHVNH
jgi:hypothetical protein